MMKIMLVAGARPNFMKIAPLVRALENQQGESEDLAWSLVHTGQHYDTEMSKAFFDDLGIPEPHYHLGIGSGSHAEQTARTMVAFEKICLLERPDVVVVVGDVNSTLACAITAKKLLIKVAHVEAGLRSGDMTMPEEINRIVADALSDYLFVTESSGIHNLSREGRSDSSVHYVGNVMIDTLFFQLERLEKIGTTPRVRELRERYRSPYAVVTLHRPSNVDERASLSGILKALIDIGRDMPVLFPVHPRTRKNIDRFGLEPPAGANVALLPPLPYMEFLALWKDAALVLTDSGGIQEETTALGIPCFTIRENTERPVTIAEGTNSLVGTTFGTIMAAYGQFKKGISKRGSVPFLWDGKAAERIVSDLRNTLP
ncbi:MAG: UDP-N-acetylglucosamine 2-epimerase (non-hydrolyzing) [Deltaproteobacteria bacterium]|nr:UDP-N-acetylglucosamine 2-epimerase (non-hydrolyzing) [Deltaproteobacteria bacterium]